MLSHSSQRRGFTLVELLIAIAAMGFVLVYTLGTFTANRNTYVVIENVSEAHQNTLAIASLVERDIRNAGYMVPPGAAACGVDLAAAPDTLFVSDSDAIRTADTLPSELAGGSNNIALSTIPGSWSGPQNINLGELAVDDQVTYDTDATVGADSDFQVNGGVIFTDLDNPDRGVHCGIVTAVDTANDRITVNKLSPGTPATSGNWAFVPAHVYRINGNALERNGVVMARNVEDLQLAWFYDLDEDGQVDANEDLGAGGTEPNYTADDIGGGGTNADPALLREIRFNLIVRTAENDPTNTTSAGTGQVRENRVNPPGPDGRRRRVHTATIRLRNL
ncbi:MAG: PilW family protein [Myxococcota bacterium]